MDRHCVDTRSPHGSVSATVGSVEDSLAHAVRENR
jgi:hypothetical protein